MKKANTVEGNIVRKVRRPDRKIVEELGKYSTTIISDCLQRFSTMDAAIKCVVPGSRIAGSAVTVEEIEGGNLMSHFALNVVRGGDVIVIDQKGVTNRAGWGGLQAYAAKRKKVAGVIVDGAVRDIEEIRSLGLPVFCRSVSPAGPHKGWGGNVNTAISCGGVSVSPGDIIVADDNGVVVIKPEKAKAVIDACAQRLASEKGWYASIDKGIATTDFLGFNKKLKEFNIKFR